MSNVRKIATDNLGQDVEFEESTERFYLGGTSKPETFAQLMELDRAGQLSWVSLQHQEWARNEFLRFKEDAKSKKHWSRSKGKAKKPLQKTVVKTYHGDHDGAQRAYRKDAPKMAEQGYFPITQSWAEGSHGCGSFLFALVLCVVLVGILIFFYMLIVKPPGTLTVTYELREESLVEEKTCPRCAEKVKAAAKACRFCNHEF